MNRSNWLCLPSNKTKTILSTAMLEMLAVAVLAIAVSPLQKWHHYASQTL